MDGYNCCFPPLSDSHEKAYDKQRWPVHRRGAAVEAALQTHGGYGFDRDYDIITLWPSARLMEIAPINNKMLLNCIGGHVLGLPKSY